MDLTSSISNRSTLRHRLSEEDWEGIRPLVTKLWFEEDKSLSVVIATVKNNKHLLLTEKTLKTRLERWGLVKKLNPRDAADLLAARENLDALNKHGFILLRGKLFKTLERVHTYQSRRTNTKPALEYTRPLRPSDVVVLSCHPRMRPEAAIDLVCGIEAILREQQTLLYKAKEQGICVISDDTLVWTISFPDAKIVAQQFELSIWASTRAFEEGNYTWAGLCWRSASLQLENLILCPDIDIWSTFIRCCVRLIRFGAVDAAKNFWLMLKKLLHNVPCSAPHRSFLLALTSVALQDIIDGSLFILEAKFRNVETLWPSDHGVQASHAMNLAEERYYQGFEDFLVGLPDEILTQSSSSTNIWQYMTAQTARISWSMLAFDYERAELLSQSCISQLLQQKLSDEHGPAIMLLLATFYSIIGRTQRYQDRFVEARSSYARSLELHQQCLSLYGHGCLEISEVYRFSVLLEYLDSILSPNSSSPGTDHARFRQRLEDELDLTLQTQSDSPLLRNTERGSVFNKFKASHLDTLVAAGGHGPGAVAKELEHTIILDGANRRASNEERRSEQPIQGEPNGQFQNSEQTLAIRPKPANKPLVLTLDPDKREGHGTNLSYGGGGGGGGSKRGTYPRFTSLRPFCPWD